MRALILAFIPGIALAGSASLNWTKPTQNTDGSALTDGTGYKVYAAQTAAGLATATPVTVTGINTLTYTVTGLSAGTWYFGVKTTATSGDSAMTNPASTVIPATAPLPPSGLTASPVVIAATAYKLRQAVDGLSLVAIGTIPIGTPCDAQNTVNGYSLVPRAAVKMASAFDTKPLITLASCG